MNVNILWNGKYKIVGNNNISMNKRRMHPNAQKLMSRRSVINSRK